MSEERVFFQIKFLSANYRNIQWFICKTGRTDCTLVNDSSDATPEAATGDPSSAEKIGCHDGRA